MTFSRTMPATLPDLQLCECASLIALAASAWCSQLETAGRVLRSAPVAIAVIAPQSE